MQARSALMTELGKSIEAKVLTQTQAAELFGVIQPSVSDLMRDKIALFALDMRMNMAVTAGMSPAVKLSCPRVLPVKRTA